MGNAPTQTVNITPEQEGAEFPRVRVTATRDLGHGASRATITAVVPIPVGHPARRCEARAREYAAEEVEQILGLLAGDVRKEASE